MDEAHLEETLTRLDARRTEWARLPIKRKLGYLREVQRLVGQNASRWAAAGAAAKGLGPQSSLVGAEEWLGGPYAVTAWITASIETLQALDAGGDPLEHVKTWTRPDGTVVARVLPVDVYERLLFGGIEAQVWMQEGVTEANLRGNLAGFYARKDPEGSVALVLGAGNVSAIVPLDILDRMFNCGEVVIGKMNPVNEYLGPVFEDIFAPLLRDGYLAFAYGGGDVGGFLTRHPLVRAIHITGSARTHDLIVYGPGAEGTRRKAADERLVDKPINSELGGVGATIVVPGDWSDADFAFQAEHIVTQKLHNSGHNCVALQVLVLPSDWDGKERLTAALRAALSRAEARSAYYPGTRERLDALCEADAATEALGAGDRLLLADVDATADHHAFREELFGPALVTTSLPGDAVQFLRAAVEFANERLFGTLSVNLIIDPKTAKALGPELDQRAIAGLRFGGIGVNIWVGAAFLLARAAWGAFPGHSYQDVQSGIGVVHNALMFDRPEKTVVFGPFRPFPRSIRHGEPALLPKPPWFLGNRTSTTTVRRLTAFAAAPSAKRLPAIFASALRG